MPDLPTRILLRWTRLLANHRIILAVILVLQAILFSALSTGIHWQPDILLFFSSDSADVQNVRDIASQPGLASQLRFDVHASYSPGLARGNASQPSAFNEKEAVIAAAKDLAQALQKTNQFQSVWTGADLSDLTHAYSTLLSQTPLLLNDDEFAQLQSHTTPDFLNQRFADIRNRLADPDGEFLLRQLAADPLNLSPIITSRLQSLSPSRQATTFHDGTLMTQDENHGWHAMLVAQPTSSPTNQKAAEITLDATTKTLDHFKQSHPNIDVWYLGAHRGYVQNAQRIKTDVSIVSILGALAVALAIALYFRRITPALLCMLPPIVGVGLLLGFSGLFHATYPLLILGFAGLLTGSTNDFAIQIMSETRRLLATNNNQWNPDFPALAARRLLGPITLSGATSVTGFAALALSSSPGLRSVGFFVAASTFSIWLTTFLILPPLLTPRILATRPVRSTGFSLLNSRRFVFRVSCFMFLGITAYLTLRALTIQLNTNPRSLDGSPAALRSDEKNFAKVWGDPRNHALVLVTRPTPAEAITVLNQVNAYLDDQLRDGLLAKITSPAKILPDPAALQSRAYQWTTFWTPERREQLRTNLATAATSNGFKPANFTKYADTLATLTPPTPQEQLDNSPAKLFPGFITQTPQKTTLATLVQMRSDTSLRRSTAFAAELRARYPQTLVLGGSILFFDATVRARAEAERLIPLCLLAILLPLLLYFRAFLRPWLVMTCLLIGLIWVLGSAALFHFGLNMLSLVPLLFTLGVGVDYGIYLSSQQKRKPRDPIPGPPAETDTLNAPTALCALTTILGCASLALALHPVMRWLGITLAAGAIGGYLSALFLVPIADKLHNLQPKNLLPRITLRTARILALLLFAALTLALLIPIITELLLTNQKPQSATTPRQYPQLEQPAPRHFTVGNSSMIWRKTPENSGLWQITLAGDPFQRGHAIAQLASPIDFRIETEMLDQLDHFLPQEWARYVVLRTMAANMITLPNHIPLEVQQEIYASATSVPDPRQYLAPTYPRILSYHALHDISQMLIDNPLIVPNTFACTGIISLPDYSGNHHLYLARLFDFEGGESFDRQKSVTRIIPPKGDGIAFTHVAWPGLAGCVTGINDEKIALFLNAAATKDFKRIGTPTIIMARDILQHAHNLAEAGRIIQSTQTFVSDIIVIADGKTGQAKVFEKSPNKTASYEVTDSAAVTNHLITKAFANDPVNKQRIEESTTMQRYTRARQLLDQIKGNVNPTTLASLLRDKKGPDGKDVGLGNRNSLDALIASHAVIIDVTTGNLWVAAYPHAEGAFLKFPPNESNPESIPPDPILTNNQWQNFCESQRAEKLAEEALHAHDDKTAETEATRAAQLNPNFYYPHALLAQIHKEQNNPAAAKLEAQKALNLDPPYKKTRDLLLNLTK